MAFFSEGTGCCRSRRCGLRQTTAAVTSAVPAALHRFCQGKSDVGGAGRDRTDDLKLAKLPLSQLSYGPVRYCLRSNCQTPTP